MLRSYLEEPLTDCASGMSASVILRLMKRVLTGLTHCTELLDDLTAFTTQEEHVQISVTLLLLREPVALTSAPASFDQSKCDVCPKPRPLCSPLPTSPNPFNWRLMPLL